jgi:hypothetical protein
MSAVWQFGWSTTTRRQRPKPAYGLAQQLNGQQGGGQPVRRASSEEAAILGVGEGLGLDTAPPGVSFGAAVGALESGMGGGGMGGGGMGRFRIAGEWRLPVAPACVTALLGGVQDRCPDASGHACWTSALAILLQ